MGAKYHPRFQALFGKQPEASTRNKKQAPPTRSSNPAVQSRRGKNKTGAVPSRKTREFALGSYFENWRGRRDQNTTPTMLPAVPLAEKVAYIPSFTISLPFDWALLANGEKVFDEASYLARCPSKAPVLDEDGEKFESRRSLNDGTENVKRGHAAPKVGENYVTPTGYPVRVLGVQNGSMVLQSLATDNRLVFPSAYPLEPFDEAQLAVPLKPAPRQPGPGSNSPDAQTRKQLAPIIDALLLKGGMTMLGIVRALKRKASAACRGKDVKANVRARMYWFRRRGYEIDADELGRLKARSPHEARAA